MFLNLWSDHLFSFDSFLDSLTEFHFSFEKDSNKQSEEQIPLDSQS